jgi:hypothetical protein
MPCSRRYARSSRSHDSSNKYSSEIAAFDQTVVPAAAAPVVLSFVIVPPTPTLGLPKVEKFTLSLNCFVSVAAGGIEGCEFMGKQLSSKGLRLET